MRIKRKNPRIARLTGLVLLMLLSLSTSAFAQGSIFGSVTNSDLTTPANGEVTFVGFIDSTDEEIRIESCDGAGYDAGNWFDDFQNYLTEGPGNPYDYYFYNGANGEGYHLSGLIPNNSFQQEDIPLAANTWPAEPTGLAGLAFSSSGVLLTWDAQAGATYHVYRRSAASNGSLFRIDNTAGSLANPGVTTNYFVDATVDGVSSYDYVIIAEDASGNFSAHSPVVTISSATLAAPVLDSLSPNSGSIVGGLLVNVYGSNFDANGITVQFGTSTPVSGTVVSPFHATVTTPAGTAGPVDVVVTNTPSGLSSNTLTGGFTYDANTPPILAAIGSQTVTEGTLLSFGVSATDNEGTTPVLTSSALPGTAAFVDNGDGTGSFSWQTTYLDAGNYPVTFYATDAVDPTLVDSEVVSITVNEAGNQAPVLGPIANPSVTEGTNLNFAVTATDPEGVTPTLSAVNVPVNATFTDNADGTGTFDFNPDFTQAGQYLVTFIASDGTLADSQVVTVTVNDAGNQTPILATIADASVTEGQNLNFSVSAVDPDSTIPNLSASNLPANATFTDNADGTGTFDFNPDFAQAGPYAVTFIASDGVLADSQVVTITVNDAGNQAPVLATIADASVTEGQNLNFSVSAADPDSTIPALSAINLPENATFIDNADGTGTFDFNPNYIQAGPYTVTFIASDGTLADSQVVTITVNEAGNQSPILATISDQVVAEGANLNFAVSASDPDSTIPALSAVNLPANATFSDNANGTGTFEFNPDFTQSGSYPVTFIASDGLLADSQVVTITVNDAGNQAPVLATIANASVTEGQNLNFGVSASDPDATIPALSVVNLPTNATFTDNTDGTGTFDFNPTYTQAGPYVLIFIASDGTLADSQVVTITVNEAGNQTPILATISDQVVTEGANLNFAVSASDPDATIPSLSVINLPANATFTDNANGTGTFNFNPDFTQAGSYPVTFIASDGTLADSQVVTITVNDAGNQAPVLAAISDQFIAEGANLNFVVSASDPDSTIPALSAINLPANATFTDNADGTGTFDFNPDFAQAGSYPVTFIASDGSLADSQEVIITVNDAGNQAPVLATIADASVTEGQNLNFAVSASDPDSTIPFLSAINLPVNATFTDNADGTGTFNFNPNYIQAGPYSVTFIASDGTLADSQVVTITVNEAGNQTPILATISDQVVTEGMNLNFAVSATDPDSTIPAMSAINLPANATFTDNADGTGTFDFNPDFAQAGPYTVTFIASDGTLADSQVVTITVNDAGNQAPVLDTIVDYSVPESTNLNFAVTASDPDSTIPTLSAENLPLNATFTDNGDGSGTFDFTPDFTQEGSYTVTFIASDGVLADSQDVAITVTGTNRSPVLATIADAAVTEGQNMNFVVTASDPDGTTPTLSALDVPVNATFTDNGDGTGTFDFNPDFTQAGPYAVTFIASDGSLADSQSVLLTVNEAGNQRPVLDSIADASVPEGGNLNFVVTASDPDGTIPTLSAQNLPANATFVNNGDGTGTFDFNPDLTQEGVYPVTFIASDAALADSQVVTITVNGTNQAPVFTATNDTTITEGDSLAFTVSATDFDGNTIQLSADSLPANAVFTDNGDGTGLFEFAADYTQAGSYPVVFIATDGLLDDTMVVTITVNEAGNQTPILTVFPDTTIIEGDSFSVVITAVDPEQAIPTLSALNLPVNATFVDNGDGTGNFDFVPNYNQSGAYAVTFIASDGTLADSVVGNITVNDAGNVPPVFVAVPDTSVSEGGSLTIAVSATDPDGSPTEFPILSVNTGLLNYDFVDNGDGTGLFTYTPDYMDAGVDTVSFLATDYGTPQRTGVENVVVTTVDINRPPVFDSVGMVGVTLGESLTFDISATDSTDPNPAHILILSVPNPPANFKFTDNRNNTGTFTFTPDSSQIGGVTVTFLAVDQGTPQLSTTLDQFIDVVVQNAPPIITADTTQNQQIVTEGQTLTYAIIATDPEGNIPTLSARNLPDNSSFVDNGDGTGVFTFSPDFLQGDSLGAAKLYYVEFRAYDGFSVTRENVLFQVNDAGNQLPVFDSIPTATVVEGETVVVTLTAYDPDGGSVTLSAPNAPAGVVFTDEGGGLATIEFTPDFTMAPQTINIQVIADDGRSQDTVVVAIVVTDAGPQPPTINPVADQTVTELHTLTFTVTTTDIDAVPGEFPILTSSPLPGAATYNDNSDGTGTFNWVTTTDDAGSYPVTFYATDAVDAALVDSLTMNITVVDTNRAPRGIISGTLYSPLGTTSKTTYEGDSLIFYVQALDPDGTIPSIHAIMSTYWDGTNQEPTRSDTLYPNMVMVDSGNGYAQLEFRPSYAQGGPAPAGIDYLINFYLVDAVDPTLMTAFPAANVPFKVLNVNAPPVIYLQSGSGPFSVSEGGSLQFRVYGTDSVDNQTNSVVLTAFNLPTNATFDGPAANVKDFRFTPDFTQAGAYQVGFVATDPAGAADTALVTVNVIEAGNQNPDWLTVLDQSISVPKSTGMTIPLSSVDPDGDPLTLSVSRTDIPDGTLIDNGDGTGSYEFTAATAATGSFYVLSFYTTDPAGASDTLTTILQVVSFLRGDIDLNNRYTMNDLADLISYVYREGPEPQIWESGDVNADGAVNLVDISYLIRFLYHGGPPPPPPDN